MNKPLIIISQPKSGTYLCSEIIKNLGYVQSYIHLSPDDYTQYDPDRLLDGRHNPDEFKIKQPLDVSSKLIKEGHFAVGHLPRSVHTESCFENFHRIVLTRNEVERQESWRNFYNGEIRPLQSFRGGKHKGLQVADWLHSNNIFHLDFSDMINKNTTAIDNLQIHILGEVRFDSAEVLNKSLQAETLTKSKKRS